MVLSALGAVPEGVDLQEDGQGSVGAVRGGPHCFAEKTGVCLKLVSLFQSYEIGWFLTASTSKLEIKEEEWQPLILTSIPLLSSCLLPSQSTGEG